MNSFIKPWQKLISIILPSSSIFVDRFLGCNLHYFFLHRPEGRTVIVDISRENGKVFCEFDIFHPKITISLLVLV